MITLFKHDKSLQCKFNIVMMKKVFVIFLVNSLKELLPPDLCGCATQQEQV